MGLKFLISGWGLGLGLQARLPTLPLRFSMLTHLRLSKPTHLGREVCSVLEDLSLEPPLLVLPRMHLPAPPVEG